MYWPDTPYTPRRICLKFSPLAITCLNDVTNPPSSMTVTFPGSRSAKHVPPATNPDSSYLWASSSSSLNLPGSIPECRLLTDLQSLDQSACKSLCLRIRPEGVNALPAQRESGCTRLIVLQKKCNICQQNVPTVQRNVSDLLVLIVFEQSTESMRVKGWLQPEKQTQTFAICAVITHGHSYGVTNPFSIQQNKVGSPHSQASVLTFSFLEQIAEAASWVLIENTALPLAVYFLWPLPGGSLNTYPVSWIAPDGIRWVWQEFCLSYVERSCQTEHFSRFRYKSWISNRLNVFLWEMPASEWKRSDTFHSYLNSLRQIDWHLSNLLFSGRLCLFCCCVVKCSPAQKVVCEARLSPAYGQGPRVLRTKAHVWQQPRPLGPKGLAGDHHIPHPHTTISQHLEGAHQTWECLQMTDRLTWRQTSGRFLIGIMWNLQIFSRRCSHLPFILQINYPYP